MPESGELTAPVFNIQSYSIHDGPGIRVTVFLKGCPLRCLWCANPESNLARPQLMCYSAKCTGCGSCLSSCPRGAIVLGESEGRIVAVTDRSRCADCGSCVGRCPAGARELAGKEMTVASVLEKALQDKIFMDESGGGITVSGGECLVHPRFTAELLRRSRQAGLHTAVESCCYAPREAVDLVFPHVDLGLLDVKHMDPLLHREYTGVSNEQILDNIRHIRHELKRPIAIRVPVIPGYNDSDDNISRTARFVAEELGRDVPVHLLPYHRLGESKNLSLGKTPQLNLTPPDDGHMRRLLELVQTYGLQGQIGG